jgi:hypothetical protein
MTEPCRIFFLWLAVVCFAAPLLGCEGATSPPDPTGSGGSGGQSDPVLDGGGTIPPPPDGAAACPAGVCNYQTGTGCPTDAGAVSCVPLPMGTSVAPACEKAGQTANGAACSQWTDCVSGSICAGNRCRKLCCGRDWTGCGTSSEHCLRPLSIQLANNTVVATDAYLCYPVNQCDALQPASCASIEANTTCQIADPTGATACLPEGTGGVASPCPCKGGFACVEGGCRRLCRAAAGGGEPSCPAEEGRCVHFNRDPGGVGECTPI